MFSSGVTLSILEIPSRSSTDTVDVLLTSDEHERGWPQGLLVKNLVATHDGHLFVTIYSTKDVDEVDPSLSKSTKRLLVIIPFSPTVNIDSTFSLNGFYVLSYENEILLSVDLMLEQIFKINIHTKQVELWYENDLLKNHSHDILIPDINSRR
ncbi:unnamed protein product [Rotaria sp. Silwood1]|nr:unnamed protein product [Rotaria sp. Silwood1]CAF1006914.1 unnamed protein product [Rotaria sp. Silwood1]CAF3416285.1 unnamed protein product [Rotaria sp. Silwood1]CAF3431103.1 unnamed protein product [Rotaria sp. Silwood1]CAF4586846.1 unnamed protein product [Rotaria sp. Silwood1]